MYKFIFLTFAFLAWAMYEMSGGADFQPSAPRADASDTAKDSPAILQISTKSEVSETVEKSKEPAVTRVSFSQPNFDLRRPNQEELDAVDPAVLASFGRVLNDEPVIEAVAATVETAPEPTIDIREVTGNRVNMRNGPGTAYSVVSRLSRGDVVEVLAEPGNGWLKLRVEDSGRIGWMADFLVTAAAN